MSEWISVKDLAPINGQTVYGYCGNDWKGNNWNGLDSEYFMGEWGEDENALMHHTGWRYAFTHWMPLPEPPKESPDEHK